MLGFACLCARTLDDALTRLAGPAGERLALLIIDLSDRSMAAAQLIERARRVRPQLALLAISGLALTREAKAIAAQGAHMLRKPFSPEELGRAIAIALQQNDTTKGSNP